MVRPVHPNDERRVPTLAPAIRGVGARNTTPRFNYQIPWFLLSPLLLQVTAIYEILMSNPIICTYEYTSGKRFYISTMYIAIGKLE